MDARKMKPIDDLLQGGRPERTNPWLAKIYLVTCDILSRLFDHIQVPENFPSSSSGATLITLDRSIVLDSILTSIARRRGFTKVSDGIAPLVLRDSKVVYRSHFRDEKVLHSIAQQSDTHKFVTFNVIYGSGPIKTTRNYSIGILDAISLLLWKNSLTVIIGEPRSVKVSSGNISRALSRALKVDFYGNLKVIRGTPFQPIKAQAETVLSGAEFEDECSRLAKERGVSIDQAKKLTTKAFYELAANPARWVHFLVGNLAKLVIWHLFPVVRVEGLQSFVSSSKSNPTVIVPVHRSHLDYILLGSILFKSRLNSPLVAAGINLNFWPVGFFLRRVGAFFVKRTGGSDPVHGLVLRRYVTYLLKRGHLLEFFIEGGRSRTGRMRAPKLGLLKAIVAAHQKGLRKDVAFVPVSISYEQVIEDKALAQENFGGKKVEENVVSLFSARSILRRSYGEVIVKFHDPIFLSNFAGSTTGGRGNLVTSLAQGLTDRMRAGTNPTLTALASTSVMLAPRYTQSAEELIESVRYLSRLSDICRESDPRIGSNSRTLQSVLQDTETTLKQLTESGLLDHQELSGRSFYTIPESKRLRSDFYRNATIHLYLPYALIEIASEGHQSPDVTTLRKLHSLFENDYLLPPEEDFVGQCLKLSPSFKELKEEFGSAALTLAPLMLPTLELYLWIINELQKAAASWQQDSAPRIPYEEFISQIFSQHQVALSTGVVTRTETFSRAAIESGIEALSSRGLISAPPARRGPRAIRIISDIQPEKAFIAKLTELIVSNQNSKMIETRRKLTGIV
jgi:glycerol-3-phosphate O-acyltransferase